MHVDPVSAPEHDSVTPQVIAAPVHAAPAVEPIAQRRSVEPADATHASPSGHWSACVQGSPAESPPAQNPPAQSRLMHCSLTVQARPDARGAVHVDDAPARTHESPGPQADIVSSHVASAARARRHIPRTHTSPVAQGAPVRRVTSQGIDSAARG